MSSTPIQDRLPAGGRDDEISLLDFAIVLAKRKWLVIGLPFLACLAAIGVSMTLTPIYTATARMLPPQQNQSIAGGVMGQLGQLGGLLGLGGALGIKNPSDIYVGILRSRTVADAMIERFGLMRAYNATLASDARMRLAGATGISIGKDNLLTIEVEDSDPKRAAALANGYIDELDKLTGTMALSEASKRRLFLERQVQQAKKHLLDAEIAARDAFNQGGIAAVDAHGRTIIQSGAQLRAQITAKEVSLQSMRGFATEENPQYARSLHELAALREQLVKLERGQSGVKPQPQTEEGLRNASLLREVRYQEILFELLARQYEVAKLEEARDATVIQPLDRAIEPDRRTRPKRTVIVLATGIIALAVAVVLAFLLEALERARRDPDGSRRLAQLRRHLAGRH
jgi:tyrosine-protein kinase Etk/Wzc